MHFREDEAPDTSVSPQGSGSGPSAGTEAPPRIRVMLGEDQPVVCAAMRVLIDSWPGLKVVSEAGTM